jgi:hypothetical protein
MRHAMACPPRWGQASTGTDELSRGAGLACVSRGREHCGWPIVAPPCASPQGGAMGLGREYAPAPGRGLPRPLGGYR